MKYYYTDPLAAAWMAKHFGMAFDIFAQPSGVRVEKEKSNAKYIAMLGDAYRCYIHPDSMHLLEPKVDDAMLIGDDLLYWVCDDDSSFWETHKDEPHLKYNFIGIKSASHWIDDGAKIIQRNGIAFMWPEVEA